MVYVLKRVYAIDRTGIKESVLGFLSETEVKEREVLVLGLETYAKQNLDFVGPMSRGVSQSLCKPSN